MIYLTQYLGWGFFVSILLASVFIVCYVVVIKKMSPADNIGSDLHDPRYHQHHTVYAMSRPLFVYLELTVIALNVLSPFLAGFMIPGKPIGVMVFKVFSTITLGQA
jgi:hypothetical protein